jgi:hypothetical protein
VILNLPDNSIKVSQNRVIITGYNIVHLTKKNTIRHKIREITLTINPNLFSFNNINPLAHPAK